jgi:O-6-methylguanine DNA methyltransferase
MKVFASVFKTSFGWPRSSSLGWAAVVFNKKHEVLRLILPTSRQKAAGYVKRFPRKSFPSLETKVKNYFDGKRVSFNGISVSMNNRTHFERNLYKKLRNVMFGKTVSYSQLAAEAGRPGAARAVGRAMSKNRVPLLIPCHRVIKADGSPGNFSADGGAALKIKMLALEDAAKQ